MKTELRILKNAVVMMLQPLILNLISLLCIGYIARRLGVDDFGSFNLALVFSSLFYPLGAMGLGNVTVRDIARVRGDRDAVATYTGMMLLLRGTLICMAVLLIVAFAFIMRYETRVTYAICIAAVLLGAQLLSESVCDVFTAFERMEYTALISLVSGVTLTALSVLVVYLGLGLYWVLGVYVLGHLCGTMLATFMLRRRFVKPRFLFNFAFWKEKLLEGLPFISMSLIWAGMVRLDTIIVSKTMSPLEIGFYTTGMLLITKINLIPEAIGGSIYPSVSNLYAQERQDQIKNVIQRTLSSAIAVALPVCIGTCLYGREIIKLIFGRQYEGAGWILSAAIWVLLFRCFQFVEFSVLAATNKQRLTLKAYIVAGLSCLVLNLVLTLPFGMRGAVAAFLGSQSVLLIFFTIHMAKEYPGCFRLLKIDRILYLNGGLTLLLVFLKLQNVFLAIAMSGIFYLGGVLALGIITLDQVRNIRQAYGR